MAKSESQKEPMRKIKLRLDKQHKDDVFVAINGKRLQIKRGVDVEIPERFARVLDNSELMDELSLVRTEEIAKNFA